MKPILSKITETAFSLITLGTYLGVIYSLQYDIRHHKDYKEDIKDKAKKQKYLPLIQKIIINTVIDIIKSYEQDNFGQVHTDISDPCKVANMLNYILGEEILSQNKAYEDFRDYEVLNAENLEAIRDSFIIMSDEISA